MGNYGTYTRNTRNGTTVVISTHAKDIVDKMQKRVVTINKGSVLRDIEGGGYSDEAKNVENTLLIKALVVSSKTA